MFNFVGNQSVISTINKMIAGRTLPHAILIDGEQGCGKRTLARFIAEAAVCTGQNPPCGECANCKINKSSVSPDITYVYTEGKKTIQVDTIREVRQQAVVLPHQSPKQVFIIENADSMTVQAQNALLKILEEPPEHVSFILIAESGAALLPTILSRCISFTLKAPTFEQAVEYLAATTKNSREQIEKAVSDAGGNIGKALERLSNKQASKTAQTVKDIIDNLAGGTTLELLKLCHPYERDRNKAVLLLKSLESELLYLLSQKHRNTQETTPLTTAALVKLIEITQQTLERLEQNVNISLALTNLCACFKSAAAL